MTAQLDSLGRLRHLLSLDTLDRQLIEDLLDRADTFLRPGGELPVNTNGGGLSHTHTGMYGMFAILESVAQLRGDAGARQVEGVELSLAHGAGGMFAAGATLILTNNG